MMHPVVAGNYFAGLGLCENPALQALERSVGGTAVKDSGANVGAGFGRDSLGCGRHRDTPFDGGCIIAH